MPIAYEETIQAVLDLLTRALKAEARVKELEAERTAAAKSQKPAKKLEG